MISRRPVYVSVSSLCLLVGLLSEAFAQTPVPGDSITGTVQKLEAVGAKILMREGKPYRVDFRGTRAGGKAVLPVVRLKRLGSLDLTGCRISDDDLAELVPLSLGQIHLAETAVTDVGMEHLATMKTLSLVNIEDTQIGDEGLAKIVTLPRLGDLRLKGSQVTDQGLNRLSSVPNLWRLSIGGSSISDESLKHLTGLLKLSGLTVTSSSVSDTGLRTLSATANLRQVTLRDSQVTQRAIDQLKTTHPKLTVNLQRSPGRPSARTPPRTASARSPLSNDSGGPPRTTQSHPPRRSHSEGSHLPVANSQAEAIAKLKSFGAEVKLRGGSVIRIEFSGDKSHLGDEDFSFLPELTSLEALDLSQTSVTDDLLKQLEGLRRLKTVRLYQTKTTWIGITELEKQIPNLKVFAHPPHPPGSSSIGWTVAAAVPVFLFTFYSFVQVFFSQFGRVVRLNAQMRSGKQLDPNSLAPISSSRAFCNAAMGFGMFFMLIGGSFLVTGTGEVIKSRAAADWPKVEGEVVVSRVITEMMGDGDGSSWTAYHPVIVYHYEVDGKKHTSTRLAAGRLTNSVAQDIHKKFPIGPATVSYNPDDSSDVLLLTGHAGNNFIPIGLGGLVVLIGSIVFVIALVKRRRYSGQVD